MKHSVLVILLFVGSFASKAQINLGIEMQDVAAKKNTTIISSRGSSKGIAIVFMGNECPFSSHYINRLKAIENQYKGKVEVVYVNSFASTDESVEEMTAFANKHRLSNYLADKNQQLKKQLGVRKTPEVHLLKNEGGKFVKFYKGPIDNNAQVESDVKYYYLKDNIENLLSGKPASKNNTPVMGCVIK